jgi:hypothetical protein
MVGVVSLREALIRAYAGRACGPHRNGLLNVTVSYWAYMSGDFGEQATNDTSDPSTSQFEFTPTASLLKGLQQ